jgi:nitrite reductase (NADH) small subunit
MDRRAMMVPRIIADRAPVVQLVDLALGQDQPIGMDGEGPLRHFQGQAVPPAARVQDPDQVMVPPPLRDALKERGIDRHPPLEVEQGPVEVGADEGDGGHGVFKFNLAPADHKVHPDPMAWTKVCAAAEIAPGTSRLCEIAGQKIAVFNTTEGFFALDDHCPHRSGPLSQGLMEGATVACPWHQWVFDLKDGHCRNIPGQKVAVFPVREQDGSVEIDVS